MRRRVMGVAGACLVLGLLATGCASEAGRDEASTPAATPAEAVDTVAATEPEEVSAEQAEVEPDDAPVVQADSCEWEAAALIGGDTSTPSGQDGDVQAAVIGAWQHTHFDTGAGYEAVENDIRYVFASADQLLYCQDVPGVTDQAENRAPITWEGTRIVLPGGAPGYVVESWDGDTMVWTNRLDNSKYLLQRR